MDQSKQSPDFATARLQWPAQLQLRQATQMAVLMCSREGRKMPTSSIEYLMFQYAIARLPYKMKNEQLASSHTGESLVRDILVLFMHTTCRCETYHNQTRALLSASAHAHAKPEHANPEPNPATACTAAMGPAVHSLQGPGASAAGGRLSRRGKKISVSD